ncbi:MAG: DNA repair protein RecO [Mycoplasmatota bacterium]
MLLEVDGIIIKEKNYGETSKIVDIITSDYGVISCLAKGARTIKSSIRSVTGKMTYGKFIIYYKKDKLSTFKSCDVYNHFKNINKDIEKISYASYLLELTQQVVKQTNANLLNLLIDTLVKIDEGFNPLILTNIIELKYLDYLGVMPSIDSCCVCGNKTNIVTLSSLKGGLVCDSCRTKEFIVDKKTIKLIRLFYYVDISKIEKLDINEKLIKEINFFIDNYYDDYTGLYLKSKNFIKQLNQLKI